MIIFAKHVHHNVLIEPLIGTIGERQEYIRNEKPTEEIELRLRLLKPVRGVLPDDVMQAGEDYVQAWVALNQTQEAYNQAWVALDQALGSHRTEIEALHRQECPDCPWNGTSIFQQGANP